jgi:hypothetical protein
METGIGTEARARRDATQARPWGRAPEPKAGRRTTEARSRTTEARRRTTEARRRSPRKRRRTECERGMWHNGCNAEHRAR